MSEHSFVPRTAHSIRQPDSQNGVVKHSFRWSFRPDGAASCIDKKIVGIYARQFEHRAHERCFVFTIAVPMHENVAGRVWLPAADSNLNRHVANVLLNELRNRLQFLL